MNRQIAVECTGVVKDFGTGSVKQRVLQGIDWQVPIGATTFLVGPSGCGKTTLISIISAQSKGPESGAAFIGGVGIVEPGATVQQGQELLQLDSRSALADVGVAQSELRAQEAKLMELQMQVDVLRARVDARVMQVIYAVSPQVLGAIVGQQVDVYIEDRSSRN